ncbi:hypothetical protein INR49_002017 [Caranx melampygus]|nr:hypothetical protein INR49_002017 [Caranx melampygus]
MDRENGETAQSRGGGLLLAEARVSIVKGQLQDVPYSSELTRRGGVGGGNWRGPLSPVGIAQSSRKGKEKGGGRGKRERKEGVLFAQLQPDHPAPSVLVTVGRGSEGLTAGPCLTPHTAPESPHGPHLDQPICLIIRMAHSMQKRLWPQGTKAAVTLLSKQVMQSRTVAGGESGTGRRPGKPSPAEVGSLWARRAWA